LSGGGQGGFDSFDKLRAGKLTAGAPALPSDFVRHHRPSKGSKEMAEPFVSRIIS
jgi:hypothetical protein